MRTLRNLHDIENKRVLLRVDFNVPIENGRVVDDNRIVESLETILYLIHNRARTIIISHLGQPEGRPDPALRLDPIVKRLRDLLTEREFETAVRKVDSIVGPEVEQAIEATKPGEILVLENVRFDPREEQNDRQFSAELAKLADAFINDAFGVCHRAHASTVGIAELLPSCAGLLVEKEIKNLEKLLYRPARPFIVILGGAKPDDKIAVMKNLAGKVDRFLVGGGPANTFLKVKGFEVKESLVGDDNSSAVAKELLTVIGKKIILPDDFVWDRRGIVDIGPHTVVTFERHIIHAKTIFWNGNLGQSEDTRFAKGTQEVAKAIAAGSAFSVVGGGDTVAAVDQYGLRQHIGFISTGGGATLEFLAGKSLPGLAALGYSYER